MSSGPAPARSPSLGPWTGARAKGGCAGAVVGNSLIVLAEDAFDVGGIAWSVLRGGVFAVFTVSLVAWIVLALRHRRDGTIRSWAGPVLMAAAAVGVLLLIASLVD